MYSLPPFCGSLPSSLTATDEQTIYQSYESYGEIDFIWYPDNGLFGTITFRRAESATEALAVNELSDGTTIRPKPFIDKVRHVQ